MKVGVIGLGKMGLLHASILSAIPNAKVVAICESKRILSKFAGEMFSDIRVVDTIQEFSNLNLDAVFVSTPIPSHSKVIASVYSIGIQNIFTEKTLAANGEESLKICSLAEKAGGVNMVGYMARYATTFQKAKELLDAGSIDTLVSFRGYAYSSDFIGIPEKSSLRGGVIRDLGSHIIDMAFWYFGDLQVESATLEPMQPANGESSGQFKVKTANKIAGEFDISWCKKGYRIPEYGLVINGSKGTIEVNNDSISLTRNGQKQVWYRADLNDNAAFMIGAPEYYREDAAFLDAVQNKSNVSPDFFTAAKTDCLIDQVKSKAAYESN